MELRGMHYSLCLLLLVALAPPTTQAKYVRPTRYLLGYYRSPNTGPTSGSSPVVDSPPSSSGSSSPDIQSPPTYSGAPSTGGGGGEGSSPVVETPPDVETPPYGDSTAPPSSGSSPVVGAPLSSPSPVVGSPLSSPVIGSPMSTPSPVVSTPPSLPYGSSGGKGSCDYWKNRGAKWPSVLSVLGSLARVFGGSRVTSIFGSRMTLMEALENSNGDEYSELAREGTASLLNAYTVQGFAYTPQDVRAHFNEALQSPDLARQQALRFRQANDAS